MTFLRWETVKKMRKKSTLLAAVVIGSFSLFSASSSAAPVVINTFDNGWVTNSGSHTPSNPNIITGGIGSTVYRHFLAFDLSAAGGQFVTSASVTYFANNGQFASPDGSEDLALYDFGGSISNLLNGLGGVAAHADLGSGQTYGGLTITASQFAQMPTITVSLNTQALADINTAIAGPGNQFVIGGALTSIVGTSIQRLWSGSSFNPAASLTIDFGAPPPPDDGVPAPGALALLAFGLLSLASRRRTK